MNGRIATTAAAFILLAALAGCRAKDQLSYSNYSQLREHSSTEAEVAAALGQPSAKVGDQWMYDRPDQHLMAVIQFDEQGRMIRKQWIDAGGETWEDSKNKDR